jgi:hypothetical protein
VGGVRLSVWLVIVGLVVFLVTCLFEVNGHAHQLVRCEVVREQCVVDRQAPGTEAVDAGVVKSTKGEIRYKW